MKLPEHSLSAATAVLFAGFILVTAVTSQPHESSLLNLNKKQSSGSAQLEPQAFDDLTSRGFSALDVSFDVYAADLEGGDFLATYLENHFPVTVTAADVIFLRQAADRLDVPLSSPSAHYKKGMICFFLALSETFLLTAGSPGEPSVITRDWNQTISEFQKAGDLGASISVHLNRILQAADLNQDRHLDARELPLIISNHLRDWPH